MSFTGKVVGAGAAWLLADRKRAVAVAVVAAVGAGAYGGAVLRPVSREAVCQELAALQAVVAQAPSYGFSNEVFDAAGDL